METNYLFWITFFLFVISALYIYELFYQKENTKKINKHNKKNRKKKYENIKQNDEIYSVEQLNNNSLDDLDSMVKNSI